MDDEKAWDGILPQFGAGNSVAPIEGWSWIPHDIWVRPGSGEGRGAGFPFVPFMVTLCFMVTELRIPRPCVDFPQARNSLTVRSRGSGDVHDGPLLICAPGGAMRILAEGKVDQTAFGKSVHVRPPVT